MLIAMFNIVGLLISAVAAFLMYRFPMRVVNYMQDGRRVVDFVKEPTEEGKAHAKWQLFWERFAPCFLALGLLLQFSSAVMALCAK